VRPLLWKHRDDRVVAKHPPQRPAAERGSACRKKNTGGRGEGARHSHRGFGTRAAFDPAPDCREG
jgi:hypothetical protein